MVVGGPGVSIYKWYEVKGEKELAHARLTRAGSQKARIIRRKTKCVSAPPYRETHSMAKFFRGVPSRRRDVTPMPTQIGKYRERRGTRSRYSSKRQSRDYNSISPMSRITQAICARLAASFSSAIWLR